MKDYNGVIKANTYVKIRDKEHLEVVKAEMRKVYSDVDRFAEKLRLDWCITFWSTSNDEDWGIFSSVKSANDYETRDYTEIFIEAPATKPTPPFKIRNGNKLAVRQWLVDNGWDIKSKYVSLLTHHLEMQYLSVSGEGVVLCGSDEDYFNNKPYLELSLNISNVTREVVTTITEPQVTNWNMVDSEKSERMELIAKIEAGLAELKKLG